MILFVDMLYCVQNEMFPSTVYLHEFPYQRGPAVFFLYYRNNNLYKMLYIIYLI